MEDNGPGIAPEIQPSIFDPFFTTREAGEGLGLGLTLCRRIVAEHGGEMAFEGRADGGGRFLVRLPVAQEAAQQG